MAKNERVDFSGDETQVLLQHWFQGMFSGLGTALCQQSSGLTNAQMDDARNELLKKGYLRLVTDSGVNAMAPSPESTPALYARLLVSPAGQAFFRKLQDAYTRQNQMVSYYSYDTTVFQMNLIAGTVLGDDCAGYLCNNLGRYRDWLDQFTEDGSAPVEAFLGQTVCNADFLGAGILSPRVAAVVLARLGYRFLAPGREAALARYLAALQNDRANWVSLLKLDSMAFLRIPLAFLAYFCGKLDLFAEILPLLTANWRGILDSLMKGDASETLSALRKTLEALPLEWQEKEPKPVMTFALLMQLILLVGLRSGKAAVVQLERLLAATTSCCESNGEVWSNVRQVPFPAERFAWSEEAEKAFDASPLRYSFDTLLAATLLHDTAQHLVPSDFWRFALKAHACFTRFGFQLPAFYLRSILQAYLPGNEAWQGIETDLPVAPLFLPERKRNAEEIYLDELMKILQDARERKEKEDGGEEAKDFGFQISLKQISKGCFQLDEIAPCTVIRSKRGAVRLKRVSLSRVRRGQYDQLMDRADHIIANLIQVEKNREEDDTSASAIRLAGTNAAVLETPGKFFLKSDSIPLLLTIKPLRLSLEVNQDSIAIKLPAPLPDTGEDPYFLQKEGNRSYSVTLIDAEVKKLFDLLHKWGKENARKIRISGKACKKLQGAVSAFSQISPYLQVLGTGSAITEISGNTVEGEVNLELRITTVPDGYQLDMLCHPVPNEKGIAVKPGLNEGSVLYNTASGSVTVQRDLRRERIEAQKIIQACPSLPAAPPVPYTWVFSDRAALLQVVSEFEKIEDTDARMTFPENQAWTVSMQEAPLELKHISDDTRGWFEIGAELQVDENRVLRLMDLLALYQARQGNFIDLGENKFVRVSDETLRQLELLDLYKGRSKETVALPQGVAPVLAELQEDAGGETPEALEKIRENFASKLQETPALPPDIDVELRPYQADAYRWLRRHYLCEIGGVCLADDMGLGKTIELLVFLKSVAPDGPSLVVVPTSLTQNWCSEGLRFTPTLNLIHFATDREVDFKSLQANDVLIVSYGLLANSIERFEEITWNVVVLDEAQAIKNAGAQRTGAAKRLKSNFRIVATGTPIENNLMEFWSLFDFIIPGLLGTRNRFKELFDDDATREEERPALRKLVTPFILRRLKRDVLKDLPAKTEILLPVELSDDERTQYESIRRSAIERITDRDDRISILAALMRLRRTCCHPSLVLNDYKGDGAKIEKLLELAEGLKLNGHRALVFSQFVDMLTLVKKAFNKAGYTYQYLDGATPSKERTAAVNAFQGGEGDFFLISLKAGGTGLNLTAADYVIILDPWWNPAVESQAADRAHRIGQRRPVTIYRLVTKDTVEEKVIALHAVKQRLVEDMLADTGSATLTPDELMNLFS